MARGVGIKNIEEVAPTQVLVALFGQPDVFCGDDVAVRAGDLNWQLGTPTGIGHPCIGKALGHSIELEGSIVSLNAHLRRGSLVLNYGVHAIGFIHAIGVAILGQEVTHLVPSRQIHADVMDQSVSSYFLDQGSYCTTQRVCMGKASVELHESSRQACDHRPAAHLGGTRFDISKVKQQALARLLVCDITAKYLEVDGQALAVFDNLGLGSIYLGFVGGATALILDANPQRKRLRHFGVGGEWVIRIDVSWEKVVEHQFRLGANHDGLGRDIDGVGFSVEGVSDFCADVVDSALWITTAAACCGDDQPIDVGDGLGFNSPAIERRNTRDFIRTIEEGCPLCIGVNRGDNCVVVRIQKLELDGDVF